MKHPGSLIAAGKSVEKMVDSVTRVCGHPPLPCEKPRNGAVVDDQISHHLEGERRKKKTENVRSSETQARTTGKKADIRFVHQRP